MFKKLAFIVYSLLLVPPAVVAQQPPTKQPAEQPAAKQPAAQQPTTQQPVAQVSYDTLLEKVKKQDPAVNFKDLRFAYTETKQYSPYGGDREARKAMFAAFNAEENEKAFSLSEKILAANYLDINAHFIAYAANRRLGRSDKSDYHKYVFENLLKSITDSGDGKTTDTAFFVISTDEEYALFSFMGLRAAGQALIEDKGHHYDQMTAIDPKTNQSSTYFFNIDKPFNWLGNSLKN
jgi:hypothetical protein